MRGSNRASPREQLLSSCSRLLAGALEGHGAPLVDLELQGWSTGQGQLQQAAEHSPLVGREQTGGKSEPYPSVYQPQNAHTELSRANTPLVTPVHAVIRLHLSKADDAVGQRREGHYNAGQNAQPGCLRHVLARLRPKPVSSAGRRHLEEGSDTVDDLEESLSTSGDERHLRGSGTRLGAGVSFWGGCFKGTQEEPHSASAHRPSPAGQPAWSVEAVSWEARDLLGCPTHDSYAALLRHLLASDPGLRHAFRAAVRAARAGKLYETTCVMSQLASQHSDLHNSAGRRCLANPWHHMPYIQVQTCLLPAVNVSNAAFCDDSGPFRTSSRKSGPHAGPQGAATTAAGIRITHCSVAPEARSVLLDGSACAARTRELMMVKSLAADVGQGVITVMDYASGAVLYQNLNSLHYMGLARSGDAGTLVLGDAQAQGLSGPGGGHGVPLLFGDADGEEAAVRVPLVLQELLRHEPGALERLVACLEAGEEFEETVQVPPTLQPVLESLRNTPFAGGRSSAAAAIAAAPPAATCPLPCAPEAEVQDEARRVRATAPGVLTAENSTAGGLLSNTSELLLLQLGAEQSVTTAAAALTGEFATASGPLAPAAAAAATVTHAAAAAANTTNSEAAPGLTAVRDNMLYAGHSGRSRISAPGNGSGLSPALMMISRASSASQQGIASRICSGTSRLGRMTRANTGAGPASPAGPGLTPVGGSCSDTPLPSQTPPAEWDSSQVAGTAGQPHGGQDTTGAVAARANPALPTCLLLPGSSGAVGSAATTPPLTPFAAVPTQQRPGVCGRLSGSGVASRLAQSSSAEPQQVPAVTDVVLSASPGTVTSGRSPGTNSTLSTLTRRLSRFLSRANTYSGGAPAGSSTPTGGLLKWNARSSRHVSPPSMASDPKAAHGAVEPKAGTCGSPPRSSFAAALAALVPSPTAHNSTPGNSCRTTGNGYVAKQSGRGRRSCGSPVRASLQLPAGSSIVLPPSGHAPPFGSRDQVMRKSMSSGGALDAHDRAGYAYGRRQPPGLEGGLGDDDQDHSHSTDILGDLGFMGRNEHVLSAHGQRHLSNNARAVITGRASTGSCTSPGGERGGLMAPLAALSPRRSVGAYTSYESAPVWSGGGRRVPGPSGHQQHDTNGRSRGHSNSGAACGQAYNSSIARSSTGIQFTGSYGRRFGGTSPRGPNTGIMVTPRRPAVQASHGMVVLGSGLMTPTAGGFASGIAPQRSVEAAAASRGEGAGAEGKPAQVSRVELAGRTDSDLQAIMAIPDRSHIFTPLNRRAAVRQALIMDSARTSTSLDMRSYSPAGTRCGSYLARHQAHLPSENTAGTQSQRTSAGTVQERHSIENVPGGGTEPTTADGEDTPSGWLGLGGAGTRHGCVTGELSELAASPFALRIDSITALRRLKTTRKPLRRVASHLSCSAASSPAVTVPDRASFGKDTAPTSTTEDQARGGAGSYAAHAVRDAEASGSSFGMKRVGSHASRMQNFGEPVAGDSAIEAAVAAAEAEEREQLQLQLAAEALRAQETRATAHSGPHVHPACTSLLQPAALPKPARGLGTSPLSSPPAAVAGLPPKVPVTAKPSPLQGASAVSDMSFVPWSGTTMGPSSAKLSCLFDTSGGATKPTIHAHYSCDGRGSMALTSGTAVGSCAASGAAFQARSSSSAGQGLGRRVSEASVNSLLLGFEVLRADIQSLSRDGSTAPPGGSGTVRNSVSASSGCSTPVQCTRGGGSGGGAGAASGRPSTLAASGPLGVDTGTTVGAAAGAPRPASRAVGVLPSLLSRHLRASASVGEGLDGVRARARGGGSPSWASEERREGTPAAQGGAAAAGGGRTGGAGMPQLATHAPGSLLAGDDGEVESPFYTPHAPGGEEALERAFALQAEETNRAGAPPPPPSAQPSATLLPASAARDLVGSPSTVSSCLPSTQFSCSLPQPPPQHLLSPGQRAAVGELSPVDCAVYVVGNNCGMIATTATTTSHDATEATAAAPPAAPAAAAVPSTGTPPPPRSPAANAALDPLIEAAASISSAICAAASTSTRLDGTRAAAGDPADGRGSGGSQRTRDSNTSAAARASRRPTSGTATCTSATLSVADFVATFGFAGVPGALPGGGLGAGEAGGAGVAFKDTLELEMARRKAQRSGQGDGLQQIASEPGMEVQLGAVAGLGVGAGAKEGAGVSGKDGSDTEAPANNIMKSGSYTAGAPTPIKRGRSAYGRSRNGRKGYARQSTHERIEQLLQAARNTASTVTDDEASGGEGRVARRETGPRVPTGPVWHNIHVCSAAHPVTGCPVLVVTQHDVTSQMDARTQLSQLLEHEHKILESIFPRHVIEYLTLSHTTGDHPGASGRRSARGTRQGSRRQRALAGGAAAGPGAGQQAPKGGLLSSLQQHSAQLANVATAHPCVTILFADIVGFTQMSKEVSPLEVMTFLNQLYSRFDALLDIYKVYKVETIGDCFMVAGGLVAQDEDGWRTTITHDRLHAVRVMAFAKAMLREARKVTMPTGGPTLMRVGMHSGPVTSGVVGSKMPRFCLFGDTVNTASRMESTSKPGRIHVSSDTHELLPNERWEATGGIMVKGKGMMATYLWASDVSMEKGERLQRVLGVYL